MLKNRKGKVFEILEHLPYTYFLKIKFRINCDMHFEGNCNNLHCFMKVFYTDTYLSDVMGKPVFVVREGQRCRSALGHLHSQTCSFVFHCQEIIRYIFVTSKLSVFYMFSHCS